MNYYLVTRYEVVTNQITIRYVPDNQRLVVILPQEDRIVTFDVPWADDAFFETLRSIGRYMLQGVTIRHFFGYESPGYVTVEIDGKTWRFKKPTATDPVDDPSTPELDRIDMAEHEGNTE